MFPPRKPCGYVAIRRPTRTTLTAQARTAIDGKRGGRSHVTRRVRVSVTNPAVSSSVRLYQVTIRGQPFVMVQKPHLLSERRIEGRLEQLLPAIRAIHQDGGTV